MDKCTSGPGHEEDASAEYPREQCSFNSIVSAFFGKFLTHTANPDCLGPLGGPLGYESGGSDRASRAAGEQPNEIEGCTTRSVGSSRPVKDERRHCSRTIGCDGSGAIRKPRLFLALARSIGECPWTRYGWMCCRGWYVQYKFHLCCCMAGADQASYSMVGMNVAAIVTPTEGLTDAVPGKSCLLDRASISNLDDWIEYIIRIHQSHASFRLPIHKHHRPWMIS
ncbi:hypothetical protein ANO11243_018190 [Dothideomycetidae sp. 11243]|nr:hypothetical protein ANO11243_018190 [fungal sp. No.11243]